MTLFFLINKLMQHLYNVDKETFIKEYSCNISVSDY